MQTQWLQITYPERNFAAHSSYSFSGVIKVEVRNSIFIITG